LCKFEAIRAPPVPCADSGCQGHVAAEGVAGTTMIYQLEYYLRFREWGFQGRTALEDYLKYESSYEFA
jgi:hypothetical protein